MGAEAAEAALKALGERVLRITRPSDKKVVLFYNDSSLSAVAVDEGTWTIQYSTVDGCAEIYCIVGFYKISFHLRTHWHRVQKALRRRVGRGPERDADRGVPGRSRPQASPRLHSCPCALRSYFNVRALCSAYYWKVFPRAFMWNLCFAGCRAVRAAAEGDAGRARSVRCSCAPTSTWLASCRITRSDPVARLARRPLKPLVISLIMGSATGTYGRQQ